MTRSSILWLSSLLVGGMASPPVNAQHPAPVSVKATHLTGLSKVKDDTKGTLTVRDGQLHFVHRNGNTDLSIASMDDVITGNDSKKTVGKTIGTLSMVAPYGGGRFLSLFRTKIDTLTIEYRDSDGALHGVIFTMPAGTADGVKGQLVGAGARTTVPITPTPLRPAPGTSEERKQ